MRLPWYRDRYLYRGTGTGCPYLGTGTGHPYLGTRKSHPYLGTGTGHLYLETGAGHLYLGTGTGHPYTWEEGLVIPIPGKRDRSSLPGNRDGPALWMYSLAGVTGTTVQDDVVNALDPTLTR